MATSSPIARLPGRLRGVITGLLALAAASLSGCQAWGPDDEGVPHAALAPEAQDVTVEYGDPALPDAVTLCETPGVFVTFDRPIERQVYDVMTAYKTGLSETLERLTAKTIVTESERYGVDPWLVVGLIRVESRFNNFAESNKGARGLMQIMPFVATELAADLSVPWTGADSLYNPVKNVKLGVAYLAVLLRSFNGNLDVSLAAYNMGPNRTREWMRDGRDLPTGYASLVTEYRGLLGKVGKRSIAGKDLRGPITLIERSMVKKNITILPEVAEVDSAENGIAAAASLPGLLGGSTAAEPAIEPLDDDSDDASSAPGDGGLLEALIAEEAAAKTLESPEPAIR